MDQTAQPHPVNNQKHTNSLRFSILVVLLIIVLAVGALFYWQATQLRSDLKTEQDKAIMLASEKAALETEAQSAAQDPARNGSFSSPSVAIQSSFSRLLEMAHPINKEEEAKIIQAINDYYKLPAGNPLNAEVLVVYNTSTPDKPNNEDQALVYIPASPTKPAGFIDMVKSQPQNAWKVQEWL